MARNRFKPIHPGDPFERLTVVRRSARPRSAGKLYWDCLCRCGMSHTVYDYSLKSGNIRSCGCLRRESMARVGRGEQDGAR
jgi:hypothetical protein